MGNMALMRPYTPVALQSANGANGANILTPDPKEVWLPAVSAGDEFIDIDLGASKYIDCFYVSGRVPVGATFYVYISPSPSAVGGVLAVNVQTFPLPRGTGGESRHFVSFAGLVGRYVYFGYRPGAGCDAIQAQIGIILAGRQFVPTWGREWESGRPIIDSVNKERLMGGGFGINAGVRKSGYDWTFGDLLDEERNDLFDFLMDVGEGKPMVMIEDSTPPTAPTLVVQAGMSVAGQLATKTGSAGFNSSVISSRSFKGKGLVTAVASAANKAIVLGLNSDPLTDNNYTGIDWGFTLQVGGQFQVMESGVNSGTLTAYTAGPLFTIAYDDGAVRYAYNGTLYRTVADVGAGREFWLDTSFDTAAGAATLNFYGPDGFAESIHYGLFNKIEKYQRLLPNVSKWNLSMEEWV